MGDRCSAYFRFKDLSPEQVKVASEILDHDLVSLVGSRHCAILDEVNYAASNEVDELRDAEIPFLLEHGNGAEYIPGLVYCDGKTVYGALMDTSGDLLVRFTKDGVDGEDCDAARVLLGVWDDFHV